MSRKDYKKLTLDEMRQLHYPCREFDHAKGFAFITKSLAYRMASHITEKNPTKHHHHHLESNEIGSVNGAKGSLRSKMLRGLFDPVGDFLNQPFPCSCKEKSLFAYCKALSKTGIWPLQDHTKKAVKDILNSPGFLEFECKIPEGACRSSVSKLDATAIDTTRSKILDEFDGLCLDCMDRTKPKTGDIDKDYWTYDLWSDWSFDCHIAHGQPTWYFSFMGRKTLMKAHNEKKKEKQKLNQQLEDLDFYGHYNV